MGRPNLSLEHLALTLAALGTSAVISACAKSEPAGAVRSDQTPATASAAAPPPPEQGAIKAEEKGREPAPVVAAPTASAPGAASALPAPKRAKDKTTGQASCGAGNCTAEMKKK